MLSSCARYLFPPSAVARYGPKALSKAPISPAPLSRPARSMYSTSPPGWYPGATPKVDVKDLPASEQEVLPQMKLSAEGNGLTAAIPMKNLSPADRALKRFVVEGNIIVTGGAGFIGIEACRALLDHGASGISIFDIGASIEKNQDGIQHLRETFPHANIITKAVDVTSAQRVNDAVRETVEELETIDALCCFAGIVDREQAIKMSYDAWKKVLDINLNGTWLCAQSVAKQMMVQGKGGSLLFTASISGHITNYPQPQTSYNVSKAGVVHMARSLAAEWAHAGIRVNTLSPGYIETVITQGESLQEGREIWTARNPMGRMGHPEELTGAIVLLTSKVGGRYITGSDICVDGGQTVF